MKDIADQVAVKQTYWFYGGLTLCPVRIVHLHTRFASQDPEDPPELGCRQFSRMFLYSLPHPGPLGRGQSGDMAMSIREAMFLVHRKLGSVL